MGVLFRRARVCNEIAMEHINAKAVLPPRLFKQVQRHFEGYLYVPSAGKLRRAAMRRKIMDLHRRGLNTRKITARVRVGPRRVRQIIVEELRKTRRARKKRK